jgi:hypothetical protein
VQHAFAGVQDEQRLVIPQIAHQRRHRGLPGLWPHVEDLRNRVREKVGVDDRSEVNVPDAVAVTPTDASREAPCEPRLPYTSRPEHGEQARSGMQSFQLRQFSIAPDEGIRVNRNAASTNVDHLGHPSLNVARHRLQRVPAFWYLKRFAP